MSSQHTDTHTPSIITLLLLLVTHSITLLAITHSLVELLDKPDLQASPDLHSLVPVLLLVLLVLLLYVADDSYTHTVSQEHRSVLQHEAAINSFIIHPSSIIHYPYIHPSSIYHLSSIRPCINATLPAVCGRNSPLM